MQGKRQGPRKPLTPAVDVQGRRCTAQPGSRHALRAPRAEAPGRGPGSCRGGRWRSSGSLHSPSPSPEPEEGRGGGWTAGGGDWGPAGRRGRLGSAPRPREAILAPGPPKAPAALRFPKSRPGLPPRPRGGPLPAAGSAEPSRAGRGGAGAAAEPGPPRARARVRRVGAGAGAAAGASRRRDPGRGAVRGKEGRERGAVTYTAPQPPPPPPRCG